MAKRAKKANPYLTRPAVEKVTFDPSLRTAQEQNAHPAAPASVA